MAEFMYVYPNSKDFHIASQNRQVGRFKVQSQNAKSISHFPTSFSNPCPNPIPNPKNRANSLQEKEQGYTTKVTKQTHPIHPFTPQHPNHIPSCQDM
jgi:hypothetical protein